MASAGHHLQNQSGIESRLRACVNSVLKEICKAYGQPVSGTKPILLARCNEILNGIIRNGNAESLENFRYRVYNQGRARPQQDAAAKQTPSYEQTGSYSQSGMASARATVLSTQNRLPPNRNYFKVSPFYDVRDTLMPLHDLPDMPHNRHTVRASLTIRPEVANDIRNDSSLKIMLFCGVAHSMSATHPAEIAFPGSIEVRINDQDVKANYRGLKNKPGSTKPVDITPFIRKYNSQPNDILVTYALTSKRFAFVVYLVRYVNPAQLTERIIKGNSIPKHQVLAELAKANADPDIAATSIRMSLKDPISTMRITVPIRSTVCSHNQCFDAAFFMQLQDQAPQWTCPVCSKQLHFNNLCVDKYFEDVLLNTPKTVEKVVIEPNGEWKMIKPEDEQVPGASARNECREYDDQSDSELVELDTPPSGQQKPNGIGAYSQSYARSSISGQTHPFATPPTSLRETSAGQSAIDRRSEKRPASAVIDLTASDEEEEEEDEEEEEIDQPRRPAKRRHISSHNNSAIVRNDSFSSPGQAISFPEPSRLSNSNPFVDFPAMTENNFGGDGVLDARYTNDIPPRNTNSQSPLANSRLQPAPLAFRSSPFSGAPTWPPLNSPFLAQQSNLGVFTQPQSSPEYDIFSSPANSTQDPGPPRLPPLQQQNSNEGVKHTDFHQLFG